MAQQGIWNPDEQYDLDPETGAYRPKPGPQVQTYLPPSGGSDYDIEAFYRKTLGRAPDANERETDLANIGKYGAAGFEQDFLSKRPNNQPGSGSYAPQQATSQYSSSTGSAAGAGDANLSQFMQYLQGRDSQEQQRQAALREILMSQLGQAQQPVSENMPGVRELLSGQRLGLQRGAERERKNAAEMRAYDGSGGLGGKAFTGDVERILQRQGEADAQMTGDVLGQQLQMQEAKIQRLLALAMQLGDSESARTLSTQLNAIQTQLSQSNFYDDAAFRYASLNSNNNLQTLLAMLNAGA
jgi:hypothetical protein